MFSTEVLPMAVKKSTAPKSGAAKKAKPAAKKAAPKAKAAKGGAKKAAPKAKAAKTAKAGAKKAAPKKAGIKLTDPQKALLIDVASKGDGGLPSHKGNLKQLTALQGKKLVKKGKKGADGSLHYHITKLGQKHAAPAPAAEGSTPSA
jgi:hypothetical protein